MVDSFEFPVEKAKVDDEPLPSLIFNEFSPLQERSVYQKGRCSEDLTKHFSRNNMDIKVTDKAERMGV